MFLCNICTGHFFCDGNSFLCHVRAMHKYVDSFVCGYKNCSQRFRTTYSMKRHIIDKHRKLDIAVQEKTANTNVIPSNLEIERNTISSITGSDINSNNPDLASTISDDYIDFVVSFLLKFYHNTNVTRKCIQQVVENTHELLGDIFSHLLTIVNAHSNNMPPDITNKFRLFFLNNPFNELLTEHKRFKYFENSANFIKATEVEIGRVLDDRRKNGSVFLDFRWCKLQVVSIEKVLTRFLQTDNVLPVILNHIEEQANNSETITSIFNAKLWKTIRQNFENKVVLPIIIYFDDFECGNPLGTQAGLHKVGAVYFTIGGIPPKYSSRLENYFLFGLFYSSDRIIFGNKVILEIFVKQLHHIEKNGISVNLHGKMIRVYFTLFLLLGDNLGVNSITGMSESFNSKNYCRVCFSSKETCETMSVEDKLYFRNPDNYAQDLVEKSNGVKEYCVLNDLAYFHTTKNVSCDIMHDLFEGICRYDMGQILYYFVYVKKKFKLEFLNSRIKYFDYRQNIDAGNRIPSIAESQVKKKCLTMSSSEMLAFVIYFPFLVFDVIDTDDEGWSFYCLLYEVLVYSTKDEFSSSELLYFRHLIKQHNMLFMDLFQEKLKPKFHFLTHYPTLIENVGPLNVLSSIRYEAVHKIGKTNAHIVTSRVNILKTLSTRYQLRLCCRFQFNIGLKDKYEFGICKQLSNENHTKYLKSQLNGNESLFEVDWFKMNGVKFLVGCAVKLPEDGSEWPMFGIVESVICSKGEKVFLYCKVITNVDLQTDICAYIINPVSNRLKYYNITQITPTRSFHIHRIAGGKYAINMFKIA